MKTRLFFSSSSEKLHSRFDFMEQVGGLHFILWVFSSHSQDRCSNSNLYILFLKCPEVKDSRQEEALPLLPYLFNVCPPTWRSLLMNYFQEIDWIARSFQAIIWEGK